MRKIIGLLLTVFLLFSTCAFTVSAVKPDSPGKSEDAGMPEELPPISTYNDIVPETITPTTQIDNTPAAQIETDKDNGPAEIVKPEKTTVMINSKYLTGDSDKTSKKLPEDAIIEAIRKPGGDVPVYDDYNWWNAYDLSTYRIKGDSPVELTFLDNANFAKENLDLPTTLSAIDSSANTWEEAIGPDTNLFDPVATDTYSFSQSGGNNVFDIGFVGIVGKDAKNILGVNLGYTTDEKITVNDHTFNVLQESDVFFNSQLELTNGGRYDVGTVTLHELGHTIGLADTYLDKNYKYDTAQVMGYYDDMQGLGKGDINGARLAWKQGYTPQENPTL